MKTTTVALSKPVLFHDKQIASLTLREPKMFEYMQHGEPLDYQMANGSMVIVYNHEAIAAYARACLTEPNDPGVYGFIDNVEDSRAVRGAVLGFFTKAEARSGDSTT